MDNSLSLAVQGRVQQGTNSVQNIDIPSGFTHPLFSTLSIKMEGGKAVIQDYTVDTYRGTYTSDTFRYVDIVNGVDTNNGLTPATAYKTLTKLNGTIFRRAYISAGNYAATSHLFRYGTGNRELIGTGEVNICKGYTGNELTWTDEGSGVFSAIVSSVITVVDSLQRNAENLPLRLTKKTTLAEASATNSFYYNSSITKLYVHLLSGLVPALNILVSNGTHNAEIETNQFCDNITFVGGIRPIQNSATLLYSLYKNCKFLYALGDGIQVRGKWGMWLDKCISAYHQADGANYKLNVNNCYMVEDGCTFYNCGGADNSGLLDGSNNASSMHDTCIGLRLNGSYYNTEGAQVHDVNSAKSLNVNCNSGESTSVIAGNKSSFAVATTTGESATMWLDRCTGGTTTTFGAENRAPLTSKIYTKKCTILNVEAGTTPEAY